MRGWFIAFITKALVRLRLVDPSTVRDNMTGTIKDLVLAGKLDEAEELMKELNNQKPFLVMCRFHKDCGEFKKQTEREQQLTLTYDREDDICYNGGGRECGKWRQTMGELHE